MSIDCLLFLISFPYLTSMLTQTQIKLNIMRWLALNHIDNLRHSLVWKSYFLYPDLDFENIFFVFFLSGLSSYEKEVKKSVVVTNHQ